MKPNELLKQQLQRLNSTDYGAYQSLKGGWSFPKYQLIIDRIPKDPYAPPSTGVYRIKVPRSDVGFPDTATSNQIRQVAFRDWLARQFFANCKKINKGRRGTGNSGVITIAEPGQAILDRTSVVVNDDDIEVRLCIGMPAKGRSINAELAEIMLFEELPEIVDLSLYAKNLDLENLNKHVTTAEDSEFLRDGLKSADLIAFIGDGAILPRASGIDQKPLNTDNVVPFKSPESLKVSFTLPNAGAISGMGIRKGVTLIVGGGYHGKSTLLEALELGVYNHIPGDGREYCVSNLNAVKVRAASGRSIIKTNISAFINNIPHRESTSAFTTANASGSTSQAAFVIESIETGAEVLLMDEDTCAMNFMIRDKRMQELVAKKHEPITSYIDKVRQLYEEHGISTILVMGGSGDYLSVSDCVIQMIEFEPFDVTKQAHTIAERFPTERTQEGGSKFKSSIKRFPLEGNLDPKNEYGRVRISSPEVKRMIFGRETVDLSELEQLLEASQTKAIGLAILYAKQYMDGKTDMKQIMLKVNEDINKNGLDVLDSTLCGDIAEFRGLELAAALNRIRSLEIEQASK
ncbi:ABC-ATPase domain-containing protein [bacterium]|nr:ABC-ATPase domain-containing protein [bacterium]